MSYHIFDVHFEEKVREKGEITISGAFLKRGGHTVPNPLYRQGMQ